MRARGWIGVVSVLVGLCVVLGGAAGCGGGGGSSGGAPLNAYESALVGDYVLVGFEVRIDGIWYDQNDFSSWAGTLALEPNRTYAVSLVIQGAAQDRIGSPWSATEITFSDDLATAGYTLVGAVLTFDYTDPSTGDREIQVWQRTG